MELTAELIHVVRRYVAGTIGLETLDAVAARHVGTLASLASTSTAYKLLGAIEFGLAELDDGVIHEDELRQDLRQELALPVVIFMTRPDVEISGKPSRTTIGVTLPGWGVGSRRPAKALA